MNTIPTFIIDIDHLYYSLFTTASKKLTNESFQKIFEIFVAFSATEQRTFVPYSTLGLIKLYFSTYKTGNQC